MIWIQVRDVHAEYARLAVAGVPIAREPGAESWGLIEMQLKDPTASGSSWSRFLLSILSGVTCDRRYHRDDQPHAA